MPEVAKCPCCGNEMLPLLTVTGCSYCAFECKLKDFPRISAAMELDELRERVAWMIECYDVDQWLFSDCDIIMGECVEEIGASYNAARKAVEELL